MTHQDELSALVRHTRGRYAPLLVSLLTMTVLYAFVGDSRVIRGLLITAFLGTMVSAVLALHAGRGVFAFLALTGLASIGVLAATEIGEIVYGQALGDLLRFLFLAYVTGAIFRDILRSTKVTLNTVIGACCVYMLIAMAWAAIYSVLELLQPGSFSIPEQLANSGMGNPMDSNLTYFSLVTMATVGYGDITPISDPARMLSALQGMIGQLFIAVILGRLVGLEISGRLKRSA